MVFRKRRKFRRKRKRKRSGPRVTKMIKDKTTSRLRYVDTISIDVSAASIANHVFRCNSVFDPDLTGIGHQPFGYDQHTLLYDRYRVLSSKITVTPVDVDSSNGTPCLWGIYEDVDGSLTYSLGTSIIEDTRNKGKWSLHSGISSSPGFTGNTMKGVSRSLKFTNRSLGADVRNNTTLVTTNPDSDQDRLFHLWCSSIGGNNPIAQSFIVQIDYVVQFTDAVHLATS